MGLRQQLQQGLMWNSALAAQGVQNQITFQNETLPNSQQAFANILYNIGMPGTYDDITNPAFNAGLTGGGTSSADLNLASLTKPGQISQLASGGILAAGKDAKQLYVEAPPTIDPTAIAKSFFASPIGQGVSYDVARANQLAVGQGPLYNEMYHGITAPIINQAGTAAREARAEAMRSASQSWGGASNRAAIFAQQGVQEANLAATKADQLASAINSFDQFRIQNQRAAINNAMGVASAQPFINESFLRMQAEANKAFSDISVRSASLLSQSIKTMQAPKRPSMTQLAAGIGMMVGGVVASYWSPGVGSALLSVGSGLTQTNYGPGYNQNIQVAGSGLAEGAKSVIDWGVGLWNSNPTWGAGSTQEGILSEPNNSPYYSPWTSPSNSPTIRVA